MTEQEALLQTILDHPDRDTPRLVYADWLEEHNEGLYAEFIRLQCAVDSLPCYGVEPDLRFAKMERVFWKMLQAWRWDLYSIPVRSSHFRRGFLIEPIPLETQTVANAIYWSSNATWLRVRIVFEEDDVDPLPFVGRWMRNVLELQFENALGDEEDGWNADRWMVGFFESPQLSALANLQILDFSEYVLTPIIIEAIRSCSHLNHIREMRVTNWEWVDHMITKQLWKRFGDICRFRTWDPSLNTYTFA